MVYETSPSFILAPSIPLGLEAKDISSNSFTIKWKKPQKLNGKINEYLITYIFMKGETFEQNNKTIKVTANADVERTVRLENLYAGVDYNINVQEKTVAYSKPATLNVTTNIGGNALSPLDVSFFLFFFVSFCKL